MSVNQSLREVIYAALFHDIGKPFYKADRGKSDHIKAGLEEAKALWGKDNVPRLVREGIEYHHAKYLKQKEQDVLPETWLIYEADNIAAGLDRRNESELCELDQENKGQNFDPKTALVSTFDLLGETSDQHNRDSRKKYNWQMLGEEDKEFKEPQIIRPLAK